MIENMNDISKEQFVKTAQKDISFVLWEEKASDFYTKVIGTLSNGCLSIEEHDSGEMILDCFDADEYKHWYVFDADNTEKLFSALAPEDGDPIEEIKKRFSRVDGCGLLLELCDRKGIRYHSESRI